MQGVSVVLLALFSLNRGCLGGSFLRTETLRMQILKSLLLSLQQSSKNEDELPQLTVIRLAARIAGV